MTTLQTMLINVDRPVDEAAVATLRPAELQKTRQVSILC